MTTTNGLRAERLIAKRYEERGYAVTREPPPSAIPFSLGTYTPDILATKGDEHLLIDVKGPGSRTNPGAYIEVDREIQRHPGWRFLLVTVADEDLRELTDRSQGALTAEAIRAHMQRLAPLLELSTSASLLLPQLWIAWVSALQLLLTRDDIQTDGLSDLSLINKAYAEGVISFEEDARARRLLKLRNDSVHSLDPAATPSECDELRAMIESLLARLE